MLLSGSVRSDRLTSVVPSLTQADLEQQKVEAESLRRHQSEELQQSRVITAEVDLLLTPVLREFSCSSWKRFSLRS